MNAPLPAAVLDHALAGEQIDAQWDRDIVARLSDYIAIPAKSPLFDPQWAEHGHLETVVRQAADWVLAQKIPGLTLEVVRLPGRTPVIFFEVAATRAVPAGALMDEARALAARIAVNPPRAVRLSKRLLREAQHARYADVLELSAAYQALAHETADHAEAVDAFLEKRAPTFTGA